MSQALTPLDTSKFEELKQKGGIYFLDFWAEWCGPCKVMIPVLHDEVAPQFPDLNFYGVNVDENPDLTEQFRISGIPTMLLIKFQDNQMQVLETFVGVTRKETLVEKITAALAANQ